MGLVKGGRGLKPLEGGPEGGGELMVGWLKPLGGGPEAGGGLTAGWLKPLGGGPEAGGPETGSTMGGGPVMGSKVRELNSEMGPVALRSNKGPNEGSNPV